MTEESDNDGSRPTNRRRRSVRNTGIAFAALALALILLIVIGIVAVDHALAPIDPRNGKANSQAHGAIHAVSMPQMHSLAAKP